jgi:hypothetical protein
MEQAAVKKDGHLKKAVSGRVRPAIYDEVVRRASAERRTMSVYLELVLEQYFLEHPMVTGVPPFIDDNDEEP